MVRIDCCADPSLAARREARRLGIAIAAIMPMIATTIKSSINEKPSWRLLVILVSCSLREIGVLVLAPNGFRLLRDAAQSAKCPGVTKTTPVPFQLLANYGEIWPISGQVYFLE